MAILFDSRVGTGLAGIFLFLVGIVALVLGAVFYFGENALDAAGGLPPMGINLAILPLGIGIVFTGMGLAFLVMDRN